MPDMARDFLTTQEAAKLAGIIPSTLRWYSSKGYAPKPAYRGLYDAKVFRAWMKDRPGQGYRTDLREEI